MAGVESMIFTVASLIAYVSAVFRLKTQTYSTILRVDSSLHKPQNMFINNVIIIATYDLHQNVG